MPRQAARTRLSATRSPLRIARAGPSTTARTAGTSETAVPSSSLASTWTDGSSARKTAAATGTPQTTPGSSSSSSARQRASSGTSASVVASPEPTSSASAAATTRSMSSCVSSIARAPAPRRDARRGGRRTPSLSTGKSSRKWTPRLSSRASPYAAIIADERMRQVEEPLETVGAADQPGVAPERGTRDPAQRRAERRPRRSADRRARRARRGGRRRGTRAGSSTRAGSRRARRCTRTLRPRRGPGTDVRPSRSVTTPPIA